MRPLAGLLLAFSVAAGAQEAPKKKAAKKAKATQSAHQKPTPEQIRKFNELEKKQK